MSRAGARHPDPTRQTDTDEPISDVTREKLCFFSLVEVGGVGGGGCY